MAEPFDERLLLLANEADEVPLISALVQDATVRADEVAYDRRSRRLVLLMNRYRWEADDRSRVRSALRIENVLKAQRQGWHDVIMTGPGVTVLELLALIAAENSLTLTFAGGPAIRIEPECVDLVLEDLSGPWSASRRPEHR